MWLTTAAEAVAQQLKWTWTYNVCTHAGLFAYLSSVYRVCSKSTPHANRGNTTAGNLQLIKQIATANEIQSMKLQTPQQMKLQPADIPTIIIGRRPSLLPAACCQLQASELIEKTQAKSC